jgi:hypothetical protein
MPELNRRYVVMTMATDAPFDPADPDGVFVLKPWKDPAALRALMVYRDNCYPELARDLEAWIRLIEAGPAVRGDVGRRNESHLRPAGGGGRGAAHKRGARARAAAGTGTRAGHARKKPASRRQQRRQRKKKRGR